MGRRGEGGGRAGRGGREAWGVWHKFILCRGERGRERTCLVVADRHRKRIPYRSCVLSLRSNAHSFSQCPFNLMFYLHFAHQLFCCIFLFALLLYTSHQFCCIYLFTHHHNIFLEFETEVFFGRPWLRYLFSNTFWIPFMRSFIVFICIYCLHCLYQWNLALIPFVSKRLFCQTTWVSH